MKKTVSIASLGFASLMALAAPAHALNKRTWVSGTGVDQAGCGPIATPCRSLQFAHDQTSHGGEIDVKDSAGYGALTITKAISIINDGNVAGVLATGNGNGITINAGSGDDIVLRGLTIEGNGNGTNGIASNTNGTLLIENCTIADFGNHGVSFYPAGSAELQVSGTSIRNVYVAAVYVAPSGQSAVTVRTAFDRVTTFNNGNGFFIDGRSLGSSARMRASISNSSTAYNIDRGSGVLGQGVVVASDNGGATVTAAVSNTTIANSAIGVIRTTNAQSQMYVGRSTLTGNASAIGASGIFSFGDNIVAGNTSNGNAFSAALPQ